MRLSKRMLYKYIVTIPFLATALIIILNTDSNEMSYKKLMTAYNVMPKLKYILLWTSPKNIPFVFMGKGQKGFISRNCPHKNCYVTSDKNFLKDYNYFDVIAFAGSEVILYKPDELPESRLSHQIYIYANIEPATNYPICTNSFDDYFNWTWTYRLNSDLQWRYLVIRDSKGDVVGPHQNMHWIKQDEMLPVSDELKKVLRGKTKTAAWFVSNCHTSSKREKYAAELNSVLHYKYNFTIDIIGACGKLICSRVTKETQCNEMIRKDYYFYLSFENAFSEDYVTENLLHAVQYNAIPIVYGGANYSRFLPEGSYLNAIELNPVMLAARMYELMNNFDDYIEYFRWTNHYSYHSPYDTNDNCCELCAALNDYKKISDKSVYRNLKDWWDPPNAICYANSVNFSFNI